MITNFNLFENIVIYKKCWIVETKRPNLEIALRKIGYEKSDEELQKFAKTIRHNCLRNNNNSLKKVCITLFYSSSDDMIWDFTTLRFPYYDYMGEVEINTEELEDYNMKKRATKYNL